MNNSTFLAALGLLLAALVPPSPAGLPEARPEALGFDPARLARVDEAMARAIGERKVPGAVVVVGRRGKIALAKAYGRRSIEPTEEAMTRDTVFDLASLTKPVATATSAMILLERGKFRLGDRVVAYLPELAGQGKDAITIDQLLRHRSGLIPDDPISDYTDGPDGAWRKIAGLTPQVTPGEKFLYSDVGYLILGRLVEKVSGQSLDEFARANIFDPLGMADTGFRPIGAMPDDPTPLARVAPTERDPASTMMLRGVVHDPRARALGGVAGHAGLFGSADDLATYAQMLLDGGKSSGGKLVLSPLTVRAMTDPAQTPEGQRRGLGWDVETSYSGPRGSLFGPSSFGHTGFTGTSLWVDPETETFVVVLTSRLHPDGKAAGPNALRAEVATLVASAIVDAPVRSAERGPVAPAAPPRTPGIRAVDCGIDVLARNNFRELRGKRVGLVTNQTGRTKAGVSTIDAIFAAPGVELVALFSPEHGIRGAVDADVPDARDERTGLTIHSLYGKARKPSAESLSGVDVLVYDIQDVGARFYTYISTLGLVLEAGKEHQVPVIVLDRPNPIGGVAVSGPIRDADFASFIAYHALPVRHGMTVGELARLFNAERSINADLTVIPVEGWRRADTYDRTALEWVNPSPNMRSLTEALLYPGVGLLEASNLATGRGTDTPFERLGAPWVDDRVLARALNERDLPGVRFVPVRFTPSERQYSGQECKGVQVIVNDWATFEPVDLGVALATTLRKLYPRQWDPSGFLKMLADRDAYEALLAGADLAAIKATWDGELAEFANVRAKYLIYK